MARKDKVAPKLSNILDAIHPKLSAKVWITPGSKKPRLKPELKSWIQQTIYDELKKHGYHDADQWASLVLTGSICTYQYGDESDLDISLFVDDHKVPDWSRAELVGICTQYLDGKKYEGVPYPLQCYVVPNEVTRKDLYAPGLRSGYELETDEWINPPEKNRSRDVKKAQPEDYAWAIQQVDKMQLLLKHDPEKAKMLWDQIHRRRRRDQQDGKGDYSQSNIVYKALANWGLLDSIAELTGEHIAKISGMTHPQRMRAWQDTSANMRTRGWEYHTLHDHNNLPQVAFYTHENRVVEPLGERNKSPDSFSLRMIKDWADQSGKEFDLPERKGFNFAKRSSSLQNGGHRIQWGPEDYYQTRPWTKGDYGKGLVHKDGTIHLWSGSHMDEDSDEYAHHDDVFKALNGHRAVGNEDKMFEVNDKGEVTDASAWDRKLDPDSLKQIASLHPDLSYDPTAKHYFSNIPMNHQSILDANKGTDLIGLPQKVNLPGHGPVQFHSHQGIQDVANSYMQEHGIQGQHPQEYIKVRPDVSKRIADEYERMPNTPHDPRVKASYDALKAETLAQYQHAVKHGYNFEFYPESKDPYPNSPREAVLDLHHNKHMYVYPTHEGFGHEFNEEQPNPHHPLLGDSGVRWGGKPVAYNDLFRAVHDFYGHAKEGLGFRADGEDNAWRQHQAMFSPAARGAMTAETRGQNSYVNYGPYGDHNRGASQDNTIFAPQKVGLMPDWVHDTDLHRTSSVPRAIGHEVDHDAVQRAAEYLGLEHPVRVTQVSGTRGLYDGIKHDGDQAYHDVQVTDWLSPKGASKQIWHELAHARQREHGDQHHYAWRFEGSTDEYRDQPQEQEARQVSEFAPFMVASALQHAKLVFDPVANKLVVGKDGALEGETYSHNQLAKDHGINVTNITQFGDVNSRGYASVYPRPALVNKKDSEYNPNKARWQFAKAIKHAFPDANVIGHDPGFNPQHWVDEWKAPELVGPRFETQKGEEGVQWQF